MFKNMRSKLIWLATMIAGFVLIDIGELTGVINGFIENALVTIGINIILAVGLNLIIGFSGQFRLVMLASWRLALMPRRSSHKTSQRRLGFTLLCWSA